MPTIGADHRRARSIPITSDTEKRSVAGQPGTDSPAERRGPTTRGGGRWLRRLPGSWADRLEVVLPIAGYALLTLTGTTTSSLSLLSASATVPGAHQWGVGMPIRSDEWLTATPIELSALASGAPIHSPLSQQPDLIYQISSGGFFETILFAEGNLLRIGQWLPDAMLFAAFRGFSWLLLFLCMPTLLRRLGATRPMAWLATVLCFLAPASLWWSFIPIRILGFAAAGCLLLLSRDQLAKPGRSRRALTGGLLLAALAGLCLARLVTYYVPWSVTVGVPLVLATGFFLVRERDGRRAGLLAIGFGALVALVLLLGTFWDNGAALHAELNTLYPGQRRSTGMAQSPFQLFGAPGLTNLEGGAPALLNQSEISSAFLICGVWALVLWGAAKRTAEKRQYAAIMTLAVTTLVGASWAVLSWGPLGAHLPLLDTLTAPRAAQTVGYPATLLLALVASRVQHATWRLALAAAAVCAAVTAYGVSDLQRALPQLGVTEVWVTVLVTLAVVYVMTRMPRNGLVVGGVALLLLWAGIGSNPIVFGLGDLRSSPAAAEVRSFAKQARADGTLWVADIHPVTALLVANGVPSLSGYQVTGPDDKAWEELDPDRTAEASWNRGASYLYFQFSLPEGSPPGKPVIAAPQNDGIMVAVDSCWLADSDFHVRHILAAGPVEGPCATETGTLTWYGATIHIYDLVPSTK